MQETWVWFLGQEDVLEEGMASHSNIPAWRIPMDRGAWQATVHRVPKNRTQKQQLSTRACIHILSHTYTHSINRKAQILVPHLSSSSCVNLGISPNLFLCLHFLSIKLKNWSLSCGSLVVKQDHVWAVLNIVPSTKLLKPQFKMGTICAFKMTWAIGIPWSIG